MGLTRLVSQVAKICQNVEKCKCSNSNKGNFPPIIIMMKNIKLQKVQNMFSDKTLLTSQKGRDNSPDFLTEGGGGYKKQGEQSIANKGYKARLLYSLCYRDFCLPLNAHALIM